MPLTPKFNPRKMMEKAIEVMRSSVAEKRTDRKPNPLVGAVLFRPDGSIETAARGELREGNRPHRPAALVAFRKTGIAQSARSWAGNEVPETMIATTITTSRRDCLPGKRPKLESRHESRHGVAIQGFREWEDPRSRTPTRYRKCNAAHPQSTNPPCILPKRQGAVIWTKIRTLRPDYWSRVRTQREVGAGIMTAPQNGAYWGQLGLIRPISLIFGYLNRRAYSGQFQPIRGKQRLLNR